MLSISSHTQLVQCAHAYEYRTYEPAREGGRARADIGRRTAERGRSPGAITNRRVLFGQI